MNVPESASTEHAPGVTDPVPPVSAGRDLVVGVVATALGLAYLSAIGWQVSAETDGLDGVSGQTLPYLIGALLALLGVALTVQALLRRRATAPVASAREDWSRWRRAALMVGLVACYWLGVTFIGYVVATAAALLAAMLFSGARNWVTMLILVLVVPPLMYWVFHELMYIPLPEAMLF